MKADCGSYFIATYIGLIIWKTHKKRLEWNRKEEKKEKESVKTIQCPLEKQKPLGWSWDSSIYCVSYSCEVCEVLILWSSHCMKTQMILWGRSKGSILLWEHVSSSQTVDLVFLYFTFYFHFLFDLFFYFLFLEQLGSVLIGHAVTSVTIWWRSHKTDHGTWENLVEDSRTNDIIQHEHHMLASWTTHGCLG